MSRAQQPRRHPVTSARRPPSHPVLAVLPFANLSAEVDEYFADVLTEDIVTSLARFRELRVIASGSTLQFKGGPVGVEDIRTRLGAGYFVQGSVRRAAGRVRISARLIDAATGVQLWGDWYDRDMGDIFAVQDEVTRTIAATLGVKMQDAALRRALSKQPVELDAYDCLLRARRYTWILSAEAHAEARDLLERAVELDPLSSDAHALLANVYLGEHRFDMNPRPNPIGRAMVHAWRRRSSIRRMRTPAAGWPSCTSSAARPTHSRWRQGARSSSTRTTRRRLPISDTTWRSWARSSAAWNCPAERSG